MQKFEALSLALHELVKDQVICVGAWMDGEVVKSRRPQLLFFMLKVGELKLFSKVGRRNESLQT